MSGDGIVMKLRDQGRERAPALYSLGIDLSIERCMHALGFKVISIVPGSGAAIPRFTKAKDNNDFKNIVDKLTLSGKTNILSGHDGDTEFNRRLIRRSILETKLSSEEPKSTTLESFGLDASKVRKFQCVVSRELDRISISDCLSCNTISDVVGGFVSPSRGSRVFSPINLYRECYAKSKSPDGIEMLGIT